MHNIRLADVLRFISITIILFVGFLYIILNILIDPLVPEIGDTMARKEYKYIVNPGADAIPEFTNNLESFFPKESISEIVETIIVSEPSAPVDIPSLQFVGMIETDKKIIYSFRILETNRLLLFEEGMSISGLTLLAIEESAPGQVYTFKKDNNSFQVDKK